MEYLVIADFKVNDGMADDMANVFKEALVDTRAFEGCNAIDVYYEEKTNTFTLIEDWATLENYETYLQWRIDTDILNPLLVGGWDGVVSSVKRLGIPKGI